jgi:hypothetical protein
MAEGREYLVSYGSGGAVGRFLSARGSECRRGDRVVVESPRGLEVGRVLCSATSRHEQLMPGGVGRLLRRAGPEDEAAAARAQALARGVFESGRRIAAELGLPVEILDVEVLLDGRRAVVQHLGWAECDWGTFAESLARAYRLEVLVEDLAPPQPPEEAHGGCGQPGCGRERGGCSSCGSGGCSSCGSSGVDLREYFAHLRSKMEQQTQRLPLL